MNDRPTWDEYFMGIAHLVKQRSTCLRRKVGAVIVKDKRVLATGYNGVPSGIKHCEETGCLRELLGVPSGRRHEICRGLHAEQNAIIQAAIHGASIEGGELYCTNLPCIVCTKMLINARITRIYVDEDYPDTLTKSLLKEAGIELIQVKSKTDDK
jgi:dCMP deaminase